MRRDLRSDMQAVFQDISGSLNPKMTIGSTDRRAAALPPGRRRGGRRGAARARCSSSVGLSRHHLAATRTSCRVASGSGSASPEPSPSSRKLLVLDEPVSALDVSTQSQAVNLLGDLQERLGVAYLFIAHDLFVVHHVSHRIAVMYLGEIVELGTAEQVYTAPRHPYTQALLSATPEAARGLGVGEASRIVVGGTAPSPVGPAVRVSLPPTVPACHGPLADEIPAATIFADGGSVSCHLHQHGVRLAGQPVTTLPLARPES